MTFTAPGDWDLEQGAVVHVIAGTSARQAWIVKRVEGCTLVVRKIRWYDRLRWRVLAWMREWDTRFEERYLDR